MKRYKEMSAFTLIELLMVIAIIGILAGILIPAVGAVRKQANVAASKSQLSNYVTAITLYKGEYGYLPFSDKASSEKYSIKGDGAHFTETLSGRDIDGTTVQTGNNRRSIAFHSFSESEFWYDEAEGVVVPSRIADRFNNENIIIALDLDAPFGRIDSLPTKKKGETTSVRSNVTAYVLDDASTDEETPDYFLYE